MSSTSSSSLPRNESKKNRSSDIRSSIKESRTKLSRGDVLELAAGDEDYHEMFRGSDQVGNCFKPVKWSETAISRFKELTLDGEQRIVSLKYEDAKNRLPDEPTPIFLYNTNGDVTLLINEVLVDETLASSNVYTKKTEDKMATVEGMNNAL